MKTTRSLRSTIRSLRTSVPIAPEGKPSANQASREQHPVPEAPFREGDVVEYRISPHRRFIVAHCYLRRVDGHPQWIVAEINADTHPADELRRVTPA